MKIEIMISHIGMITKGCYESIEFISGEERPKNVLLWFTPFLHKLNNISSAFFSINTDKFSKNR